MADAETSGQGCSESQTGLSAVDLSQALRDEREDRYHRLKLIRWWEQDKLRAARVMVVGAGALGNEIIKNLALLGVGHILVCDFDVVEPSNLSRSILFRREDEGHSKARIAAERARSINPDIQTAWFHGDVVSGIGMGVIRRMDVVLGGLDNREARIAINSACWRMGVPFVDGGTHTFEGQVRVFAPPEGPCYECTLSAEQYEAMQERIRCNLLLDMSEAEAEAKVSTTPVASSIIAAIQVQEALELLHGMEPPRGKTIVYNGPTHEMYVSAYEPKDTDWHQHSAFEGCVPVIELPGISSSSSVQALLNCIRKHLGPEAVIDLERNIVERVRCEHCGSEKEVFRLLRAIRHSDLLCPECGKIRDHQLLYAVRGDEPWLDRRLSELGLPALDVVCAHSGDRIAYFELTADAPEQGFWRGDLGQNYTAERNSSGASDE